MSDLKLSNRRVIIREDLNVPIQDGVITSNARIQRALPTLKKALSENAAVIVLSHLGRPEEEKYDPKYSLDLVADHLSQALSKKVELSKNWLNNLDIEPGEIVLCENVRFNAGEKANNPDLSKKIAALCDIFVMDAFATAHRAQSSTVGVIEYCKYACAGPLLQAELENLSKISLEPKRPFFAIIGGSKVSTKFKVLAALIDQVDGLIVGGGIANTFLAAAGLPIGRSLHESDWVEPAKKLLEKAEKKGVDIPLPVDLCVARKFSAEAPARECTIDDVDADEIILDIGSQTAKKYESLLDRAETIVWNGPVGVFEFSAFSNGTLALAEAVASSDAFSIVGGGDTVAALEQFALSDQINYISTGGGAFLEYLEGKTLPALQALEKRFEVND